MPELNPKHESAWPGDRPKTKEELHRDRFAMLVVVLVFAALLGLVILAAVVGPAPETSHFPMPFMP
jgi:hypothetical protein